MVYRGEFDEGTKVTIFTILKHFSDLKHGNGMIFDDYDPESVWVTQYYHGVSIKETKIVPPSAKIQAYKCLEVQDLLFEIDKLNKNLAPEPANKPQKEAMQLRLQPSIQEH